MKKKFLSLVLAVGVFGCPDWSGAADIGRSSDEQQIRKIEREWLDAIVKRDASYLQQIEAPDFTMTGPDGKTLSKEEDIKDTTSGETVFEDIQADDIKVRFSGDTAIATGLGRVKAHSKDESINGKYSWTDIFVKMNGEWKAVAAHVTAVAPEKE
jgi:ketosteroid isomerase-like protein